MQSVSTTIKALRGNLVLGLGFGLAAFGTALVSRFALEGILPPGFPYLTFFPAVFLTAFAAGTRAGIGCAILSGLSAWYFFIPPRNSFVVDTATAFALGFYVFIVSVVILLFNFMYRTTAELRREREVTADLYERQRTMFQELQHRVANNMSVVAALLTMQRRKVTADPSTAAKSIDEAIQRIGLMSNVHRRLYDPASGDIPIARYFDELCSDLIRSSKLEKNIECVVDMVPVKLPPDRLMTLSLMVSELVTNSLKHAFGDRDSGIITLVLTTAGDDMLELSVSDNGIGLPPDHDPNGNKGLGTMIIGGLADQLSGTIHYGRGAGTTIRLVFKA